MSEGIQTAPGVDRASGRVITTPQTKRRESWRSLRASRGWSLREVEERCGINRGLLSRIEHGFGPTPDQAMQLLTCYGVSFEVKL